LTACSATFRQHHAISARRISAIRFNKEKSQLQSGNELSIYQSEQRPIFPTEGTIDKDIQQCSAECHVDDYISKTSNLRIFYRTFVRTPGISQLQDVVDNSNPLLLSTGNKDLNQQYNHFVGMRYRSTKIAKGLSHLPFWEAVW
jgi:hypothetical protein